MTTPLPKVQSGERTTAAGPAHIASPRAASLIVRLHIGRRELAAAANSMVSKASLLGLPGELRNQIYGHVIGEIKYIDEVLIVPDSDFRLEPLNDLVKRDRVRALSDNEQSYSEPSCFTDKRLLCAQVHPLLHVCQQTREEFGSELLATRTESRNVHAKVRNLDFTQLLAYLQVHDCDEVTIELVGAPPANPVEKLLAWKSSGVDDVSAPGQTGKKVYKVTYTTYADNDPMEICLARNHLAQYRHALERFREDHWQLRGPTLTKMSMYCGQAAELLHKHLLSVVDAQTSFVMESAWRQVRDETLDWRDIRELRRKEVAIEDQERIALTEQNYCVALDGIKRLSIKPLSPARITRAIEIHPEKAVNEPGRELRMRKWTRAGTFAPLNTWENRMVCGRCARELYSRRCTKTRCW